jgi:predicted RNA-binding protein
LDVLNIEANRDTLFEIIDLYDDKKECSGTLVRIDIPQLITV